MATTLEEANSEIEQLKVQIDDHECICFSCDDHECESPKGRVTEWLDRQTVLGLISADGRAAVERLLEDLQ